MGGKHLNDATRKRIIELGLPQEYGEKPLSASKIIETLRKEREDNNRLEFIIPESPRTVHNALDKARRNETPEMKFDREPWSMLRNKDTGIPFDPILLELRKLCFQQQSEEQERRAHEGKPKLSIQQQIELHEQDKLDEEPPIFVTFPVGVARWAVQLHKTAPYLNAEELLKQARQYFRMERIAKLTRVLVDSSYDDLRIALMNPETDPKLIATLEKVNGDTLVLPGQEVKTEYGKAFESTVTNDTVAKRILPKKEQGEEQIGRKEE